MVIWIITITIEAKPNTNNFKDLSLIDVRIAIIAIIGVKNGTKIAMRAVMPKFLLRPLSPFPQMDIMRNAMTAIAM